METIQRVVCCVENIIGLVYCKNIHSSSVSKSSVSSEGPSLGKHFKGPFPLQWTFCLLIKTAMHDPENNSLIQPWIQVRQFRFSYTCIYNLRLTIRHRSSTYNDARFFVNSSFPWVFRPWLGITTFDENLFVNCSGRLARGSDVTWRGSDVIRRGSDVTSQRSDVIRRRNDVARRRSDVTRRRSDVTQRGSDVTWRWSDVIWAEQRCSTKANLKIKRRWKQFKEYCGA